MTCSLSISVEPCSILHLYYNIYCSMLHLYYTIYCTVYCLWRKWDYTECVRGNVNSTDCTVHSVQCTLHTVAHQAANCTSVCSTHLLTMCNVQCALHLTVYTLHWSQIVFMVTLALLTRARYSQKLDHGDLDQMTLGGNRTNIVWMNCEFSMKEKLGQIWTVW